jgi:hypothetical protein
MCRQILRNEVPEAGNPLYLAVQTGREFSIVFATADVRCAIRINSAGDCNTKFGTGREPAIRLRANCSLEHRPTAVKMLLACCKRCAQPTMLTTIGRHCLAQPTASLRGLGMLVSLHPETGH